MAAAMVERRVGHAAVVLPDSTVLIVGGSSDGPSSTAELYSSVTDAFTPTGAMAVGRGQPIATLLPNGDALVVGGDSTSELYDFASGTFVVGPPVSLVVVLVGIEIFIRLRLIQLAGPKLGAVGG